MLTETQGGTVCRAHFRERRAFIEDDLGYADIDRCPETYPTRYYSRVYCMTGDGAVASSAKGRKPLAFRNKRIDSISGMHDRSSDIRILYVVAGRVRHRS
jgi:hypothetical protein